MPRIIELALYGIRHVQSMTRLSFGPGLNVLSGGVGSGKSTLCELIAALLCPELTDRFRSFVHPHHTERAQAAVVFQAADGGFYRVIRDFIKDRINLTKIEAPGQTAGGLPPLANDMPSVMVELQRLLPGMTADQIARYWLFSPARMSSLPVQSKAGGGSNGAATPGGHVPVAGPTGSSVRSPADRPPPAPGTRLDELRHALAKAEETLVLDEQVMAAQDRASTIKQKLVQAAHLTEERDALQNELKGFTGFDQLPAGFLAMIEGLAERERTLHSQLEATRTQLQELEAELAALPAQPIFQQRRFQTGVGLTVLALLVALLINLPGLFRYVFLALLVPGLGVLVWSVVNDMRIQSARAALEGKIKSLKKEQEISDKQFNREQKPALELLALTKSNSVAQFKERARNVSRLRDQIEQLTLEQTQLLGGQTVGQLQEQLQTLSAEARALEERLREAASIAAKTGMGDVASLQAEISRLESGGAAATNLEFAELTGAEAPPLRGQSPPSPAVTWQGALRALWPHEHPALQTAVSTLFSKLSGGGYSKAVWSDNRLLIQTQDQREIDPELLSSGQRDLLALACFLAPWLAARAEKSPDKAIVALGRFPLLLDDPFQSLDPAAQSSFMQLLRSLGASQQILLATRQPVPEQAGDHRIALPIAAPAPAPAPAAQARPAR
ncbi:MAG TPA: hypothetical protein VLY45_01210 [Nitrospiria bacterium]|nr:hypothetical protein [Nitrospiria bacterium]